MAYEGSRMSGHKGDASRRRHVLGTAFGLGIVLAVLAAGCGSAGNSAPSTSSGSPAASQETTAETSPAAPAASSEGTEEDEEGSNPEPEPDGYQRASEEAARQHEEAIENSNRIAQETGEYIENNKVE